MLPRIGVHKVLRVGSAGLLAGCMLLCAAPGLWAQDSSQQAVSQQGSDPVQSAVAGALAQDSSLQGQAITATVAQGIVTLTGTVQTDAQRQQAETVAANVSGVSGILNHITVSDGGAGQASAPAQATAQVQNQEQVPPPPPPDAGSQQEPYPPQNQPNGYSGARPAYSQQQGYYNQAPPPPSGPLTVPAGTLVRVRLSEPLDTSHLKNGTIFQATAAADIYENGALAIPRGATLTGQVVEAKKGGDLGGSAVLALQLTSLNLEGRVSPITTDVWSNKGPNKAGYTARNTAGGAIFGAILGGVIGRGAGAAIGAGAGAVTGLAASAATNGPRIILPAEASVDFHLAAPVTVQPVSWQEAQRLASSAPAPPQLMRRPQPAYVMPGYYPAPYYPYPY
jgi:hypothetical protein